MLKVKKLDQRNDVRNVAIIAHVDHGKTTLVDQLLRQSGIFRQNEQVQERVMDSNDLERERGSIIVHEAGETTGYGLFNTQERGRLFVGPGVPVYEGMVVGECAKNEDIVCNVCKKKQMTNTRAAGSDDALRLVPPTTMSLEQCMEFIKDDELLEVTPSTLRLRKTILAKDLRMKKQFGKH